MGRNFDEYLAYTVYRCVARPKLAEGERDRDLTIEQTDVCHRWDLRRDGWPPAPTQDEIRDAKKWIRKKFDDVCAATGFLALSQFPDHPEIRTLVLLSSALRRERGLEPPADHDAAAQRLFCPLVPSVLRGTEFDQKAQRRFLRLFGADNLARGGPSAHGYSPGSEDAIAERAIRSLHDWRATLAFLSELRLLDKGGLLMGDGDPAVVDAFNIHITRGRKPNFIHSMLCHLSAPARFRVILTTNFDTLIEDAFKEMGEHIETISVSLKGTLPDPEVVHARDTVVKMHGTLSETRADFSLDESPSKESRRRFFHYVLGHNPGELATKNHPAYLPSHLLVCGYSGNDTLCVEMMKHLLDAGGPDAKIFWVCNSGRSTAELCRNFPEEAYKGRIIVTQTDRLDLLLYELFQHLCLSLPGGGFSYQYTPNVPPAVRLAANHPAGEHCKELTDWFKKGCRHRWAADDDAKWKARLRIVNGRPGVLETLRNAVDELVSSRRVNPIWLELEDYADTWSLAYEFLLIISIKLGLFQLGHADLVSHELRRACEEAKKKGKNVAEAEKSVAEIWKKHLKFLQVHYFNLIPSQYLIVIYARNGPGGCSGWGWTEDADDSGETATGGRPALREAQFWNDKNDHEEYGNATKCGNFAPLLRALCETGFHVIYAPYSEERAKRDAEKWSNLEQYMRNELPSKEDELEVPRYKPGANNENWRRFEAQCAPVPQHDADALARLTKTIGVVQSDAIDTEEFSSITFKNSMTRLLRDWIRDGQREVLKAVEKGEPRKAFNNYKSRLRMLYAATLFRQSRHYSAFLSEAVVPCQRRFNTECLDNDWLRDSEVQAWRDDLMKVGFFYEKPGGFMWAYRDFRLGVRRMLDILPKRFREFPTSLGKEKLEVEPFADWRSHYHYYIADWYLRAFYTTGHATPLAEALHHLFQCIAHLSRFRASHFKENAKEAAWRRYRRWRSAVCDMTKALRVGGEALRLWFGPPQFRTWFSPRTVGEFTGANTRTKSNGVIGVIWQNRPRGESLFAKGSLKAQLVETDSHQLVAALSAELRGLTNHSGEGDGETLKIFGLFPADDHESTRPILPKDDVDALRKRRPTFASGSQALQAIAKEAFGSSDNMWSAMQKRLREHLERNPTHQGLSYLVQELGEGAFLLLRRAKLRQLVLSHPKCKEIVIRGSIHSGPQVAPADEWKYGMDEQFASAVQNLFKSQADDHSGLHLDTDTKDNWRALCVLCAAALEASRLLHPALSSFEEKERVRALCLYAIGLARLGRFFEAHCRLNEADALLSKIAVDRAGVLLGILKLRRAEVHMLEAMLCKRLPTDLNDPCSEHLRKRYPQILVSKEDLQGKDDVEKGKAVEAALCRRLAYQISKLDDAWRALEQAERLFSGRLRSSRWWARLCAIRLRCLSEQPGECPTAEAPCSVVTYVSSLESKDSTAEAAACIRPLSRRIQSHPLHQIAELYVKGIASTYTNAALRLRLTDFALRAAKRWRSKSSLDEAPTKRICVVARDVAREVLDAPAGSKRPSTELYAACILSYLEEHF